MSNPIFKNIISLHTMTNNISLHIMMIHFTNLNSISLLLSPTRRDRQRKKSCRTRPSLERQSQRIPNLLTGHPMSNGLLSLFNCRLGVHKEGVALLSTVWIINNECSKHMCSDKSLLSDYVKYESFYHLWRRLGLSN